MKITKQRLKEIIKEEAGQMFKGRPGGEDRAAARKSTKDDLENLVLGMAEGKIPLPSAENIITAFASYVEGRPGLALSFLKKAN